LLAVGLIAAFSMPALAVDVQFSGEFKAEGWYDSNRALRDDASKAPATGIFDQSLRVNTVFKVAEGLSLVTRFDALTKIWGDKQAGLGSTSAAFDTWGRVYQSNRALKENIDFERAYAEFKALGGLLRVGYAPTGTFGTKFADYDLTAGMVRYYYFNGPWTLFLSPEKGTESEIYMNNGTPTTLNSASDVDYNYVQYGGIYKWSSGDVGLAGVYYVDKTGRTAATPYQAIFQKYVPYVRMTSGPIYFEAEALYLTGDKYAYENGASPDVKKNGWSWYANAKYSFGPAFVGAQYAHVGGDDPGTTDKDESGPGSGREYKPTLILINPDRDQFLGRLGTNGLSNNYSTVGGSTNFNLYQIYAGFKPMAKLDLLASYSYVKLCEKAAGQLDDKIGSEFDVTATYKIYDNLSYMIGFGYLSAGDAYKGSDATAQIANDWLLMHRLTLTF